MQLNFLTQVYCYNRLIVWKQKQETKLIDRLIKHGKIYNRTKLQISNMSSSVYRGFKFALS
jgi:hypothetical protein